MSDQTGPDMWVVWRHLTHGIAICAALGLLNAALLVALLVRSS